MKIKYHCNEYNKNNLLLLIIIVFALIIRLATLEFINPSDNANYWFAAKLLYYNQDYITWMKNFPLAHQTTRFGVILPVLLLQKLFGVSPYVMYILPVTVSIICSVLIFKIGSMLKNSIAGFIAALLFIIYPPLIKAGSQIYPDLLCSLYILLGFYIIVWSYQKDKKNALHIIIAAVLSFLAYLAKEPAIFLVIGLCGALYILTKSKKDVLIFAVVFSFLFFLESCFYYIHFDSFLGRFYIVKSQHLTQTDFPVLNHFYELLYRYVKLPLYWKITVYVYFALLFYLFVFDKKASSILKSFAFIGLSFFFFTTFTVKSIHPLIPVQHFQSRYLDAGIAFIMPVISYYFVQMYEYLESKNCIANRVITKTFNIITPAYIYTVLTFIIMVVYISLYITYNSNANIKKYFAKHPLLTLQKYYNDINTAYQQGYPIIFDQKYIRKSTFLLLYVLLDQKSLPVETMLNLPSPSFFETEDRKFYYFIKNTTLHHKNILHLDKYIIVFFDKKFMYYEIVQKHKQ